MGMMSVGVAGPVAAATSLTLGQETGTDPRHIYSGLWLVELPLYIPCRPAFAL